MVTLVADRFLQLAEDRAVDLATGEAVVLRTADSILGAAAQQAWTDACAARLGEHEAHTLIDFGLVGSAGRFEAYRARALVQPLPMPLADVAIARQAVQQAIDWLEDAKAHSPRILYAMGAGCRWLEQLARAIRLHGFIPLNVSLVVRLEPDHCQLFSGRAIVLLELRQDLRSGAELASAIVTAAIADAREIAAIVHVPPDGKSDRGVSLQATLGNTAFWPRSAAGLPLVARAAESRSVYGSRGKPALLVDSRGMHLLDEARQWASRGRHAAAERAARAALAAFDRRDDLLHAGDGAMLLGRLLLDRGRAAEARTHFDTARDKFQQLGGADSAVRACVFSGLAQTDEARIEQAEQTLRSAYSAASALQDAEAIQMAGIALARNMYWQQRYDGARTLLEELGCDQLVVRYWCLMSRLGLAIGNVDGASQCAGRARDAASESPDAPAEAIIRLAHVRIQATLGDVDALGVHMRAGLAAARAAHLPLAALKMRVAFFEGLLNAGQVNRARAAMSRAKMVRRPFLPPLLKQRLDRLVERVSRAEETGHARPLVSSVHETAPSFPIGHIDRVTELLAVCHDVEDERRALSAAAIAVRKHTGALATGIFGATDAGASPFGVAGTIAPGTARRAIDLTYAISPESAASGVEAAVPIQHLGRTIGAMACRWSVEGPRRADDVLGFMRLGAAACAPLVQIVLARDCMPLQETAGALELIGSSAGIDDVRRLIARAANAPFTVLIEGESGSGKELVARAIHSAGCRRERIFCALNCAALTEELVDAELFGHVKGAFTGAATDRLGLFESADQGTVFLDEVGELSSRAQAKLLRVLQEGEIRRVGENFTRPIDARLVAATNRPLKAEVEAGRFRQDLLYRLDVIRIAVPPLRERVDDIPLLASRFWKQATDRIGSKAVLGPGALSALARYDWPGNVRELQNVLTALAVSVPSRGIVGPAAMPAVIAHATRIGARETLDTARRRFEERFVRAALARSAGHRGQTAAALGVSRQGLAKLMQRLQI
jgi:transcriptional regulator with AAA-type ATPase domain/tetratricopeptide (TPR) repeat protein